MRVFKGLLTSNWALGFPKIHDRISITHALVFIIFSGCATLEGTVLAIVPYVLIRGPVTRIVRRLSRA